MHVFRSAYTNNEHEVATTELALYKFTCRVAEMTWRTDQVYTLTGLEIRQDSIFYFTDDQNIWREKIEKQIRL